MDEHAMHCCTMRARGMSIHIAAPHSCSAHTQLMNTHAAEEITLVACLHVRPVSLCTCLLGTFIPSNCPHLVSLDLSGNVGIVGKGLMPQLAQLTHLHHLNLSYIDLSSFTLTSPTLALFNLTELILEACNIGGAIPELCTLFPLLRRLSIKGNQFDLTALPTLSSCPLLEYLDLSMLTPNPTVLDVQLPHGFLAYTPLLQSLIITNNNMAGPLPLHNSSTALHYFDAHANRFVGSLPSGRPVLFFYFDVSQNLLTGTLPSTLSAYTLDVSFNQLVGDVVCIDYVSPTGDVHVCPLYLLHTA